MPPSRREELVETAMRVFARRGFHGTGIEQVLQEAGICRMTLYNHFKSKEELIIAALRRRDEIFRNRLMKFVAARGPEPIEQLLAFFDFYALWFEDDDFCGCMFINAAAEYHEAASPVRKASLDHKVEIIRHLRRLCERAELSDADALAEQLGMLLDGAVVTAHIRAEPPGARRPAAEQARHAAEALIRATRRDRSQAAPQH